MRVRYAGWGGEGGDGVCGGEVRRGTREEGLLGGAGQALCGGG